ncbi:MAG: hypothetical protein GXZ15_01605 [Campylobacter sp.]|nr:hypothetical protein [Campylobacter sp.]
MKIFLSSKNPAISSIVNICCERTDNDLVSDENSADLVIKDCEIAEDVENLDNTLYLIPKDLEYIECKNRIIKPFLPTEMIKFIKNFTTDSFFDEEKKSELEIISDMVKEIDELDNLYEDEPEHSKKEMEFLEKTVQQYDDDNSLSELVDEINSELSEALNSFDADEPLDEFMNDLEKTAFSRCFELHNNTEDTLSKDSNDDCDTFIDEFSFDDVELINPVKLDNDSQNSQENIKIQDLNFDTKSFEKELKEAFLGDVEDGNEVENINLEDDIKNELKKSISTSIENALRNGELQHALKDMKIKVKVTIKDID